MKKLIFACILLVTLVSTLSAGHDVMYVYRKDGIVDSLLTTELDSICYSKLDLDSVVHKEYVVQEAWTTDSIYRTPLAMIDSVSWITPESYDNFLLSSYVNYDFDNCIVSQCDTTKGHYELSFTGDIPKIDIGNAIIVKNDTISAIVLVTNVDKNGSTLSVDGVIGDLSYVFKNTEFYLETDESARAFNKARNVYYPTHKTRASHETTLWSTKRDYTSTIFKNKSMEIWAESSISAQLSATIKMAFRDTIKTEIQGIEFIRSKNFDVDVCFHGNLDNSESIHAKATGKGKIRLHPKDTDDYEILKHNFFPPKEVVYTVCYVPIAVLYNSDLYAQVDLEYDMKMAFDAGIKTNVSGDIGISYNGNNGKDLKPYKNLSMSYNIDYPSLSGEGELEGKLHIFPRFRALIYNVAGPSVDIKPYMRNVLGGAFKTTVVDKDKDFIAATLKSYCGLDCAFGLSAANNPFGYETWNISTDDIHLLEGQVYESPVDLKFKEASMVLDVAKSYDVSFEIYDRILSKYDFVSSLFPVVKFESYDKNDILIEDDNVDTYAFAQNGVVTVRWTPKEFPSKLVAKIFDLEGEVIASDEFSLHLCPDENHPHLIDLGLPSGTLWYCCNEGASSPTRYGNYYAWGETSHKASYRKENYEFHHINSEGKYVYDDTSYDWAPSQEQVNELLLNCVIESTVIEGTKGDLLTGPNGNSIFLPFAGAKSKGLYGAGTEWQFWTNKLDTSTPGNKAPKREIPDEYKDDDEDEDEGHPYAFDWKERDLRYIGKTIRRAIK